MKALGFDHTADHKYVLKEASGGLEPTQKLRKTQGQNREPSSSVSGSASGSVSCLRSGFATGSASGSTSGSDFGSASGSTSGSV